MAKAIVVNVDEYPHVSNLSELDDYQQVVEGRIEYMSLTDNVGVYLNDEGRFYLDDNLLGTFLIANLLGEARGKQWLAFNGPVQGNVVFIGPADDEGETMDLPQSIIDYALALSEAVAQAARF